MRNKNKLIALLLFLLPVRVMAANCGGATTCNCNDTITSNYTLPADLICPYDGSSDLSVLSGGAGSITLNMNGHRISGFNATWPNQPYTGWPSGTTDQEDLCINWGGVSNVIVSGAGSFDGCKTGVAFQNTNSTVTLVTVTNAGQIGINVNAPGEVVSSNTVSGVFGYAIRDVANGAIITSNTITGNYTDVQINSGWSIQFGGITTGLITNNYIHDNSGYAFANAPAGVIFSGNRVVNQKGSLFTSGGPPDLGFDATNTLDGYVIKIASNTTNATYDGNLMGNAGYFGCVTCSGVTLQNMPAIEQVYLSGAPNFLINNISIADYTANSNALKIDNTSPGGTIQNSTFTRIGSSGGAVVAISTKNITVNNINCSSIGAPCVFVQSGVTGTVLSNIKSQNDLGDIADNGTGTSITNSSFLFPKGNSSTMITWNEATRTGPVGTTISYSFNMTDAHGEGVACPSCSFSVASYPPEVVTAIAASNVVSGSFIPHQSGTYSLLVTVSDANGNQEVKNFLYLIGNTSSQTTRYYYRYGKSGNIVNGLGMDGQPMTLAAPVTDEIAGYCSGWVQDTPADIPPFPFAQLNSVSANIYYTVTQGVTTFGLERFAFYENAVDTGTPVATPGPYTYTTATPQITQQTWMMDSPGAWNGMAVKLVNTPNPRFPEIQSLAASPSYADFTYIYASTTPVKSISNILVPLLASTTGGVTLDNPTGATASQTVVVGGLKANAFYSISQDGYLLSRAVTDSSGFLTESLLAPIGIHTYTTSPFSSDAGASGRSTMSGKANIK